MAAHQRLAHRRRPGETLVAVSPDGDPGGVGPALQIVTDEATTLLDSVTVLLHRLGLGFSSMTHPVLAVRRDADGVLLEAAAATDVPPAPGTVAESWIHVALVPPVNRHALDEAVRMLPLVVADARQVADDSPALTARLGELAAAMDTDSGVRFAGPDRADVADLLRWLSEGNFVLLGAQRCTVGAGAARAEESSRLGVARLRTEVLPELSGDGGLLVLAQATMPSFLRYGAYPYIVAVREQPDTEHRFVGLFTASARNANVLDIPLVSRRVQDALETAAGDPGHPGQLILDVISTIPRSELFTRSAQQLLDMARAVIDLGSRQIGRAHV